MNNFITASLNRKRTVLTILLFIFVSGIYAYITIPKESKPDINIPIIYVSMTHEGISPEDAEKLLIRPMEEELSSIEGTKEMRSTGFEGGANIVLEFTAGFDADKALDDVRLAVDKAKPELPSETDEPKVSEVNFSLFPVLVVTLSGEVSERTLLKLARSVQDKIENISTVLEAPIAGDRAEQIEIVIDPERIASYGINSGDVIGFFQKSDRLVAAGNLDTGYGRFAIKVPGTLETIYDIRNMPLKVKDDSVVMVKDIAQILQNFKDPESFARLDGQRSIAIEVVKRTGENIIDTIQQVKDVVRAEQKNWPTSVEVHFIQDESSKIRSMLADLQNNIISAIILVMVVCVAALGVTSASLVGIAIPGAFLAGVLLIFTMGLTINIVVLFGLILSIGMLVDGAIVVTEYADRKMNAGWDRESAYKEAAQRMAWPIISSTATTLAAFCPLLFWPGLVGQFMKYMPITLIAVLSSSLFMALIFVPTLGSIFGRSSQMKIGSDKSVKKLDIDDEDVDLSNLSKFTGLYVSILDWSIKRSGWVISLALVMLISVQIYYKHNGNGVQFFAKIEPENASVLVHARGNLSIQEKNKLVKRVDARILDVAGIKTVYSRTGSVGTMNENAEDVIGVIHIEFDDWDERDTADKILSVIKQDTKDIAGIIVETVKRKEGPQSGKALQLQLRSYYPELLLPAVIKVRQGLTDIGGFIDVEDSRSLPGIEWELQIDRAQAAKFGLDTSSIGQSIRLVTNGLKISEYRSKDSDDEMDVIARYSLPQRSLDQLDQMYIETSQGSIPIVNFVKRVPKQRTGKLTRADGYRIMTIKADLPPNVNIDEKIKDVEKWIKQAKFHPDIQLIMQGDNEDQKEAQKFLVKAFIVALFIMAVILVTQFNRFYSAFLVLSAVIMSTIGVMLGLLITGQPFGIVMTGIGVIALAGIIVNNNIVLIDTFDKQMAKGKYTVKEAILRTGAQRLRPVLLTTTTTCLGLLPMVFQVNIDFFTRSMSIGAPSAQWWVDLSTAITFGLVFSTPLTLIVTPAALMFRENFRIYYQRFLKVAKTAIPLKLDTEE